MGTTSSSVRRTALIVTGIATVLAGVLLAPAGAWAVGETITDVRILDNQRTDESTVRSLAGISIGDTMELDTLERVRERLNTAGLFADVNVWWEQHGEGVRVNVAVKDKFPWAPVPTASWSANNRSLGLVFVHGNLFGRGKQMLFGGRIADVDSGATLAFRDPSLFGTWIYWQMQGFVQKQAIPEYDNRIDAPAAAARETRFTSYGFEAVTGIAWLRRVRTQVGWQIQKVNVSESIVPKTDLAEEMPAPIAAHSALVGIGRAGLSFDFRAREFAVMTGMALGASIDLASTSFGSNLEYWRVGASFERGVRFFKSHNLIYSAYTGVGHNLPFWNEYTGGGPNLRGYLFQQFRGDTQVSGKVEYHFPLFSIGSLEFRALGFYDVAALWFRDLPPVDPLMNPTMGPTRPTLDARNYLPSTERGFSASRDIHNAVGGGLRFFLRSVAIPLVGFDAGYGIESRAWRFFVIVGA